MAEKALALPTAQNLTERTFELLDEVKDSGAAVHLQMALDVLTNAPVACSPEETEAMMKTPKVQDLLQQLGLKTSGAGPHDWTNGEDLARRAQEEPDLAAASRDPAVEMADLDRASQYAAVSERVYRVEVSVASVRELYALARLELDRRDAASSLWDRRRHAIIAMFFAGEAWRQIVLASHREHSFH